MAVEGQRLMTKTQHYRKVTKPLLERKRRARMNLYLDELKDLIVDTMEAQGEHVNKLEKADILEMTVTYLKSRKHDIATSVTTTEAATTVGPVNAEKFRAGYTQAAYEVSKIFATLPGLDLKFGTRLMKQLGHQLKDMRQAVKIEPNNANDFDFAKPNEYKVQASNNGLVNKQYQQLDIQAQGGDVWRPW